MSLSPADREAIVAAMAAEEEAPKTEEGEFFVQLKRRTVRGYYTSRIGIHDEMDYKGNTMQEEYSGIDVSKPSARVRCRSHPVQRLTARHSTMRSCRHCTAGRHRPRRRPG